VSKNEAVCREVQTHFGSFRFARFIKSSGSIITIYVSKNEAVCREVQTNFGSFRFARFIKSYGSIFTIYVSKNEAVCREVQTHFRSFLRASFMHKVLGALSRFLRPKTKLFAVEFRRILEVLCVQFLQKKLWEHFHDLCVRK